MEAGLVGFVNDDNNFQRGARVLGADGADSPRQRVSAKGGDDGGDGGLGAIHEELTLLSGLQGGGISGGAGAQALWAEFSPNDVWVVMETAQGAPLQGSACGHIGDTSLVKTVAFREKGCCRTQFSELSVSFSLPTLNVFEVLIGLLSELGEVRVREHHVNT